MKSDSHLPKNCFICFNESPLKMMKDTFYFISKPLLVLVFVLSFWPCRKNAVIAMIRLISKPMTSQSRYQTITKHIFPTACHCHVTYELQSESMHHSLPEYQGTPCSKQAPYLKFKWQQRDSNTQTLSS